MTNQILINGVKYTLKYSLRNLFVFEEITNRPFVFGKIIDEILLFYSTLLANNESFSMEFDKFVELCDDQPNLYNEFKNFYVDNLKIDAQKFVNEEGKNVKKKTRAKPKK